MLRSIVRLILIEGKMQDLEKKYVQDADGWEPDKLSRFYFNQLASADPSPTKKYLEWMIKRFLTPQGGDINDIIASIQYFHENIQRFPKKDINSYKTLKELEDECKRISEEKSKKEIKKDPGNALKLFEDDKFLLVRPNDKNASIKYGAGTKWCITMADANYYEQYTESNVVFYFFIDKTKTTTNDDYAKIALAVMREDDNDVTGKEWYDARDNRTNENNVRIIFGKELVELALNDVKTVPKCFESRLKSGEIKSDDELLNWWQTKFPKQGNFFQQESAKHSKKKYVGYLSIRQQVLISTIDEYMKSLIDLNGYFVNLNGEIRFAKKGSHGYTQFERISDGKIFNLQKIKIKRDSGRVFETVTIESLKDFECHQLEFEWGSSIETAFDETGEKYSRLI